MPTTIAANIMMPILLIDIVGHTTYRDQDEQNQAMRKLQELLNLAGKSVSPYRPFMKSFPVETTGDGYYLLLEDLPSLVALRLTQALRQLLRQYQEDPKNALPLAVRLVLAYGNVQMVGDQLSGAVMAEANRLISDKGFKTYQQASGEPSALFASALFYQAVQDELRIHSAEFPELATLPWQRVEIKDKHKQTHIGYLQGEAMLDELPAREKSSKEAKSTAKESRIVTKTRGRSNHESLVQRHCDAIRNEHGRIRLLGYVSGVNLPVNLLQVFVHLRLAHFDGTTRQLATARQEANDEGMLRPDQLLPRVKDSRKIILILGGPGSGKTTLLQYFAVNCLDPEQRQEIGLDHPLIPLFIPLRDIAGDFRPELPFIATVSAWLHQHNRIVAPETLESWLRDPGCLVLLDGLDEVSDRTCRRQLCEWIDMAFHAYGPSRFMVTCRFTGYREVDGVALQAPAAHVEVRDFEPEQQRAFLRQWFLAVDRETGAVGKTPSPAEEESLRTDAERQANAVMTYLSEEKNRSLRELAGTPMLLQIMAIIWKERHNLSGSRATLYDECMKYLLEYRDIHKKIEPLLNADQARRVLLPLALWLQRDKRSDEATLEEVEWQIADPIFRVKPLLKPREFLDNVRDRAGVLVGATGKDAYTFQHKTFREYLAAVALANFDDGAAVLVKNFADDWWKETLLFAAGLTSSEIGSRFFRQFLGDSHNDGPTAPLLLDALRETIEKPQSAIIAAIQNKSLTWQQRYNALRCLQHLELGEAAVARFPELIADLSAEEDRRLTPLIAELLRSWGLELASPEMISSNLLVVPFEDRAEYLLIPGGRYTFSVTGKPVTVPDLYVAKYPVTNRRYELWLQTLTEEQRKTCRSRYADDRRFNGPDQPVVGIRWSYAMGYCGWVTSEWRKIHVDRQQVWFRLPTEIEWEWAAGGGTRLYPWGDEEPDETRANYGKMVGQTTPVGSYPAGATPAGLMDMAGNVWEWCLNDYEDSELMPDNLADEQQQWLRGGSNAWKALRGGSCYDGSSLCRCAGRSGLWPYGYWSFIGVRVAVRDWS